MKKRYIFGSLAITGLAAITLAACGSKTSSSGSGKNIKATITFVNQKTDMHSNGMWKKYIAEFNKEYPNITIKEQALNNYDQTEQTRMSSKILVMSLRFQQQLHQKTILISLAH
ncbi:hypothetical protein OBG91_10660 [Lactococcus lactis]|nr:hypothetical protein [Lactococcus lactis]